ncbi:MAG: DNA polymerase III subunit gamma/tau [Pseudomonadales bacterium]|jgi:DNA polymerase-3 subunit gamma/tau|nr:DNA polymerase III subunit gamma/tau [Pseudomonadales bacterium]
MSYQVLARKWRPRNFSELVGQEHVLKTLINALDSGRLHHAYLFTGTRGVGKTTIARILARCLNCETGVTSTPCGECGACREISEGRFLDLIEVDAASRTKVEDTRELLENVQYAPSRGRYKVYLIDEVHMLSNHSFNALLKTLEEPPPHVKFLLATTDPQKLPVTVLSRCLQFNLKNLSPERLVEHLKYILGQENIAYEEGALWQLGRAAQGSVRDCLTLLDQAIGYCDGTLSNSGVSEFLGSIDQSVISGLMDALIANDAKAALNLIAETAQHAPDYAALLQELLSWLHRVAIAQVLPDAVDNSQGDRDLALRHGAALSAESVQLYYQIALKGREELPWALDARSGVEMTLLRMFAFAPAAGPALDVLVDAGKKKAPVATSSADAGQKKKLNETPLSAPVMAFSGPLPEELPLCHSARSEAESQNPLTPQNQTSYGFRDFARNDSGGINQAFATASEEPAEAASPTSPQDPPPAASDTAITLTSLSPQEWPALFRQLPLNGVTRSMAGNSVLTAVNGKRLSLTLDENQATLFNDEHRARIQSALGAYFGQSIELSMQAGKLSGETPLQERQRLEREYQEQAREKFHADPLVQEFLRQFDAQIQPGSISPLHPFHWQ